MSSFSSSGSIYRSLRFRPSVWEGREGYRRVAGEGFIRFSFPSFPLPLTSLLLLSPLPLGSLGTQSILIVVFGLVRGIFAFSEIFESI